MNGNRTSKWFEGVVAVTAVLVSSLYAGAAFADQPASSIFTDSGSGVFADCGDFAVVENATVSGRDRVYFDRDAHAIRHVVQLRIEGTFSNSETGEVISPDHAAFRFEENLSNEDAANERPRPGTFRVLGITFQMKVDGKVAAIDAGQLFVDIHEHDDPSDDEVIIDAGRHDAEDGFDICAALA